MLNTPDNPLLLGAARKLHDELGSNEIHYFGSTCKRCACTVRVIATGACTECAKAQKAAHNAEHRAEIKAKKAEHYATHRGEIRKKQSEYYAAHRDAILARNAVRYAENRDVIRAKEAVRASRVVSNPCPRCGEILTASVGIHANLASTKSHTKFCKHCRPDQLEALQPEAECYLYAAELDGRHGQITGFGIAANTDQRWRQHERALRAEGMHIVGAAWVSQRMARAECLRIESRLKTIADGIPVPGFKTESFKGHCLRTVLDLIAELT